MTTDRPRTPAFDTAPAKARTVAIVANPAAGGFRRSRIEAIDRALQAEGLSVELRFTERAGDLLRLGADPDFAPDVIAVAGGDGSINELVGGLHQRAGFRPSLAVIPSGTANVLADELGLPRGAAALARMIGAGAVAPLHYGLANGRPFVLMASAGFDAEVVHAVSPGLKRNLKQLAFVLTALRLGLRRASPDLAIEVDGDKLMCRLAIVTKAAHYGGPFVICAEAGVTRPGLHLVTVADDSPAALMRLGAALLAGRIDRCRDVSIRPATRVVIAAETATAVQIDGEIFGATPVEVTDGPAPLSIIVPA